MAWGGIEPRLEDKIWGQRDGVCRDWLSMVVGAFGDGFADVYESSEYNLDGSVSCPLE